MRELYKKRERHKQMLCLNREFQTRAFYFPQCVLYSSRKESRFVMVNTNKITTLFSLETHIERRCLFSPLSPRSQSFAHTPRHASAPLFVGLASSKGGIGVCWELLGIGAFSFSERSTLVCGRLGRKRREKRENWLIDDTKTQISLSPSACTPPTPTRPK